MYDGDVDGGMQKRLSAKRKRHDPVKLKSTLICTVYGVLWTGEIHETRMEGGRGGHPAFHGAVHFVRTYIYVHVLRIYVRVYGPSSIPLKIK